VRRSGTKFLILVRGQGRTSTHIPPAAGAREGPGGERRVHEISPRAWKEVAAFTSFGCTGVGWVYLIVWVVTLQI